MQLKIKTDNSDNCPRGFGGGQKKAECRDLLCISYFQIPIKLFDYVYHKLARVVMVGPNRLHLPFILKKAAASPLPEKPCESLNILV